MTSTRRVLLISGSLRARSTNTAVLRTAQALAPDGIVAFLYHGLATLPHFNPDDGSLRVACERTIPSIPSMDQRGPVCAAEA